MRKRAPELSGISITITCISIASLVTFQRPCLLLWSHWWLGFNMNLDSTQKHSVYHIVFFIKYLKSGDIIILALTTCIICSQPWNSISNVNPKIEIIKVIGKPIFILTLLSWYIMAILYFWPNTNREMTKAIFLF